MRCLSSLLVAAYNSVVVVSVNTYLAGRSLSGCFGSQ